MNVKILKHYLRYCKKKGVEPNFKDLRCYNELAKDLYIPTI